VIAQERWPNRPIRMIVPYPAGGNSDMVARWAADRLAAALGQPVIIENRAGAGATIGAQVAARAEPDGYTLLLAPTAVFAITPHLQKVPYDALRDFTPIATISNSYGLVAARKDLPANNMKELIALARQQPGRLTFGSAGVATATHLSGEVVHHRAGIKLVHVPYKGSAPALNDLVAGQIDLIYDPVALSQVKAGKVKALASTAPVRHPELPEVATLAEQGIDASVGSWFGILGPARFPAEAAQRIAAVIRDEVAKPETRAALQKFGQYPEYTGLDDFARRIEADSRTYQNLIAELGIKLE
jgi:tripartite-type tricarboxylate transporter receptor subunit TctC